MSQSPLQQLLGPVDEKDFFNHYWQQRSLLIQGRKEPWPFTFDQQAFFSALPACDHLKMAFQNQEGQHKECDIDADQAKRMYEAGTTLCATRIDYGDAGLRRFLDQLEDPLLGGEFHMNSYLSPGGKGFGVHYDYHSVWVLQLEGSKTWFYSEEPAIRYPILNLVYPLKRAEFKFPWYTIPRPDETALHEATLEPGDLLYLPAGAWHKTQANGYSLSITMCHEPVQAAKFITDVITGSLWNDEASRCHLPPVLQSGDCEGASEDALHTAFEEALATLRHRINRVTPDQLLQAWKAQVRAEQKKRRRRAGGTLKAAAPHPLFAALTQQRVLSKPVKP